MDVAGPTGFEGPVAAIIRREAAAFAEVSDDVHGSTTAVVRGTAGGGLLAVFAHCDEVARMSKRGFWSICPPWS